MSKYEVKILNGRIEQTLDLNDIFGVDFSKRKSIRDKIVNSLIEKMKDRISEGLDRFGEPMAPYSEVYKSSFNYIAARKDGTVNMRLTGDMLGSLDVLSEDGGKVKIGFVGGEQQEKAYAHFMGTNKLPVRQFFGVTQREVDAVKSEFDMELKILADLDKQPKQDNREEKNRQLALDILRKGLEQNRISEFFSTQILK
jgi:hypothetical protein